MSFGRPTKLQGECPRCDELKSGAKPRSGWGDTKKKMYDQWKRNLDSHNCEKAKCGPVCTYGDW